MTDHVETDNATSLLPGVLVLLRQLHITTLMWGHGAPCPDWARQV